MNEFDNYCLFLPRFIVKIYRSEQYDTNKSITATTKQTKSANYSAIVLSILFDMDKALFMDYDHPSIASSNLCEGQSS